MADSEEAQGRDAGLDKAAHAGNHADNDIVYVPINFADYLTAAHSTSEEPSDPARSSRLVRKLSSPSRTLKRRPGTKVVAMTSSDFDRYWAKDADAHFLPHVEEPTEGRAEWLRRQLELPLASEARELGVVNDETGAARSTTIGALGVGIPGGFVA